MAHDLRCNSAPSAILRIARGLALRLWGTRRFCIRRCVGATLIVVGTLLGSCHETAAQQPPLLMRRSVRNEAVQAIPFEQFEQSLRAEVSGIVNSPSLYRRLPAQVIDCDPDLFLFLVRYPEVIVDIWRLMEVTKVQVTRTSPTSFSAADGSGTVANVHLIYSSPEVHVFYATGYYEGPLLRNRLTGSCVLVLRAAYGSSGDRIQVTSSLDVFARLDNAGVELLAKTLNPLVGKTADYNFVETAKFVSQLSQASEKNGPGVQRLAANLTGIDPQVRDAFARYTDIVYQRGVLRQNESSDPLTAAGASTAGGGSAGGYDQQGADQPSALLQPVTPRAHAPQFRR
jgi:hypothetical protein